jgi:hypothetical protein
LLADQVSLGSQSVGQLGVALLEHFVEVGDFICPGLQIGLDKALGLQGLSDGDFAAFLVKPRGHFGVDLMPRGGQLLLLVTDGRFAGEDLCLFLSELALVPRARVGMVKTASAMKG